MKGVAGVDKRLVRVSGILRKGEKGRGYHKKGPGAVIEKDSGSYNEHGKAGELVELSMKLAGRTLGGHIGAYHCCCRFV